MTLWLPRFTAALHRWALHLSRGEWWGAQSREELRDDAQSLGFGIDLCRVLQEELPAEGERLTLLDVGARTATGSALIARTFHPQSWSGLKFDVTALDLNPHYAPRALANHPEVDFRVADVMDVDGRWDVVVCSHTLEHIADPDPVFEKLCALAGRLVVVAAPWKEPEVGRYVHHLFSFDERFFERHPADRLDIYDSPHWSGGRCFVAVWRIDRS